MIRYKSIEFYSHEGLVAEINRCQLEPEQIVSITSTVIDASTYKWDHTQHMDIDVKTRYVLIYWYEED